MLAQPLGHVVTLVVHAKEPVRSARRDDDRGAGSLVFRGQERCEAGTMNTPDLAFAVRTLLDNLLPGLSLGARRAAWPQQNLIRLIRHHGHGRRQNHWNKEAK